MTMKIKLLTLVVLVLLALPTIAQELDSVEAKQPSTLLFHIHEDFVYPSADYIITLNTFKAMAVEYKFDTPFIMVQQDNGSYLSVSPIKELVDISKTWEDFAKVPKDVLDSVMSNFNGQYDKHRDYIARLHLNLSHNPTVSIEENYRVWNYYWFKQDKTDAVIEIAKEWKALYEAKGILHGYQIWSPGFGHTGPALVVISWAKDAAEYEINNVAERELLGEEGKALSEKTRKLFYKMDKTTGWVLYEQSYTPVEK